MREPLAGVRAARAEHVPIGQTTLPHHAAGPPVLDPAPHVVVSVGDDAAHVAEQLLAGRPPDRDRHSRADADPAGTVVAELAGVVTGWRVLAVGPERDVLAVRAAALARGALDAEIVLVPTDACAGDPEATRPRTVFCGACHQRFDARAAVRDRLACPGCAAVLTLAAHHSRRRGAFLGAPTGRTHR